jgi:hypothetical protein
MAAVLAALGAGVQPETARAAEPERDGVTLGASLGVGVVARESGGLALSLRGGYALTPELVIIAEFERNGLSPEPPSDATQSLDALGIYTLSAQLLTSPRVWLRPGFGVADAKSVHYQDRSSETATYERAILPALTFVVGMDAITFSHGAMEVAFTNCLFLREQDAAYRGAFLIGFSYY